MSSKSQSSTALAEHRVQRPNARAELGKVEG